MSCAGCLLDTNDEEVITCSIEGCKQSFHAACTNAARLSNEEIRAWACPDCTAAARRGGDNSHTPVRVISDNVTTRKKKIPQQHRPAAETDGATANFAEVFLSLSTEFNLLRQSASEMWNSLKDRLDDLCDKISSYDSRLGMLEKLESENTVLKATVADLQYQLRSQAQASLSNEVEILGIDEFPAENPYHVVLTTAVKLGVELSEADLVHVSRVGPKRLRENSDTGCDAPNKTTLQRPIAVAFVRRVKRDEFLKQAKVRRSLKSGDIVHQGSSKKVYINERLTSANRRLFRSARIVAKERGYKYCWVRNGNILIRKQDARTGSPAILIRSDDELKNLPICAVQPEPRPGPGLSTAGKPPGEHRET